MGGRGGGPGRSVLEGRFEGRRATVPAGPRSGGAVSWEQ
ncbi:hypothetical protein KCH_43410 [Kitasatospora cheerisanensis KCTC 2395]|uniref:Uncharacterized protein n=1 Tax=Kitasatospora cheerisanensis KCTC 2395 TaxID=1348663 RepID=A0A066YR75_9ACTN|nr:hypothetical protein KCH_43410 [Kitasatospora cheerisanensis KCTC 2395]